MSKRKHIETYDKEDKDFLKPLLQNKYEHLIFIVLILALLSIFFFRMGFLGYVPKAHDTVQWRGAAQVVIEHNEEHRDQGLWSSNIFSGMPAYLINYPSRYPFIKNIFNLFTLHFINWGVFYMFLAGLGMYVLMLFLGFKPLIAFITGMSFALSCHFVALIDIGHNTKFRAIIYMPWIMWGLLYLFKHRNVLGMGLTAMFIIQQLRENHLQITYYTFIMIGIFWVISFFQHKKERELKEFFTASILLALTMIVIGMAVSHPHLSVWEYGKHTIRGGEGLTTEYATSWSFHPLEMITFIIPDFFGGVSPYYWGWMPFTQASMYMGVVILALALIAVFNWKEKLVKILTVVTIVALLLSFGKHFSLLSNLLLSYFPLYNKFRVPATILVLVQFAVVVLAGYGLKYIIEKYKERDERFKNLTLKLFIGAMALLILFIIAGEAGWWNNLPLEHHNDAARYEPRQLEFLKELRLDALQKSGLMSFGLLSLFLLLTYLLVSRKGLTPYLYLVIIAGITVTDVMIINKRHFTDLVHKSQIEQEFRKTEADRFLLEDEEMFRIFPLREEFGQSSWAYYHQTIGGYHGAKLRRYQDILDHNLYTELKYRVPINWNIVRMLNVKYLVSPVQLPFDNLQWAFYDREKRVTVYELKDYLPRAWFVDEVETITDRDLILRRLNLQGFDPQTTAIAETYLPRVESPDSSSIEVTNFTVNRIDLKISTDKNSFLVLSEVYYPAGWNAYLNGEKIDIHPANYVLRGMEIPPGNHTLEVVLEPVTHRLASILSLIGILAAFTLVGTGCYQYYKRHFSGGIDYVIKG